MSWPASATNPTVDPGVSDTINLLDRWLDARQAYEQIPGFSIAIVHDQALIWAKGYGKADLAAGIPATPETIYSICSISKLFTSVAAMHLVDQGKVQLTDPIDQVLPWFSISDDSAKKPPITLFDTLTHSSGYKLEIGRPPDDKPYLYRPTQEEFRELVRREPLSREPGTRYIYSNIGIALAGEVVEAVSGRPLETYLKEEFFDPLEMASTTADFKDLDGSRALATGYGPPMRGGGRLQIEAVGGKGLVAAMGLYSTVLDLARFSSWQFRLLNGQDEILQSETYMAMIRPQFVDPVTGDASGFGFAIDEGESGTFVGHGGDCPGYRSDLVIEPEGRVAVAVIANGMEPVWEFTAMAHKLMAPVLAKAHEHPGARSSTPARFEPYIGTYQGFPWSGEWQIIPWGGSLAVIYLPADEPLQVLRPLRHIDSNQFRTIDKDGKLGMWVTFESDDEGEVVQMRTNEFPRARIR